MNKKDFFNLMYNLFVCYQELLQSETNMGILTLDFENNLNKLKTLTAKEHAFYEQRKNIFSEIVIVGLEEVFADEIRAILAGNENKLVGHRIAFKTIDINRDNLTPYNYLFLEIKNDFFRTILYFINNYLYDPQYEQYREFLLQMKYTISFMFSDIESNLIDFDMQINPNLFWLSSGYTEYKDCSYKTYEKLVKELINIPYDMALSFFATYDFKQQNTNKKENSLFYYIVLRSCFIFFKKEQIASIREINHSLKEIFNIKDEYYNMLEELCNLSDQDKEIPIRVRLINI